MSAPEQIYLQWNPEAEQGPWDVSPEGVTWCVDQINDSDVLYIRADLVPPDPPHYIFTSGSTSTSPAQAPDPTIPRPMRLGPYVGEVYGYEIEAG